MLSRAEPDIGEAVILDTEGNVCVTTTIYIYITPTVGSHSHLSFCTSILKTSAIIIASASGRDIVLQRLLELGADVSGLDIFG